MRRLLSAIAVVALVVALIASQGRGHDDQAAGDQAVEQKQEAQLTANQKEWIQRKRDEILPKIRTHEQQIKLLREYLEKWEADVRKNKDIGPWREGK